MFCQSRDKPMNSKLIEFSLSDTKISNFLSTLIPNPSPAVREKGVFFFYTRDSRFLSFSCLREKVARYEPDEGGKRGCPDKKHVFKGLND
jgi:hypothetical protein